MGTRVFYIYFHIALHKLFVCFSTYFLLGRLLVGVFDPVLGEGHGPNDLRLPRGNSGCLREAKTGKFMGGFALSPCC